jgi:2'-5' RNA ligase
MTGSRSDGLRTFVAVPLPVAVQAPLFAVTRALAPQLAGIRWARKVENLHVTIRFLGQIAEQQVDEIGKALSRVVGQMEPFEVGVRGLGAFPSTRKASVIWAGVDDPAGRVAEVAEAIETAIGRFGVAGKEPRPFRAHVTIGRSKGGVDAREALRPPSSSSSSSSSSPSPSPSDQTFGRFVVDRLHLYESQLGSQGSTYVLRCNAPFRRDHC